MARELGNIMAEAQGPFAPEILPNTGHLTVFSRRFDDGETCWDIYASPVLSDEDMIRQLHEDFEPEFYEVLAVVETRESWDSGGDTSDYEYITLNTGQTFEQAMRLAREWIEEQDPEDY